jgi:hypothetical protein
MNLRKGPGRLALAIWMAINIILNVVVAKPCGEVVFWTTVFEAKYPRYIILGQVSGAVVFFSKEDNVLAAEALVDLLRQSAP